MTSPASSPLYHPYGIFLPRFPCTSCVAKPRGPGGREAYERKDLGLRIGRPGSGCSSGRRRLCVDRPDITVTSGRAVRAGHNCDHQICRIVPDIRGATGRPFRERRPARRYSASQHRKSRFVLRFGGTGRFGEHARHSIHVRCDERSASIDRSNNIHDRRRSRNRRQKG